MGGEALRARGEFADPLPEAMRDGLGLVDRTAAMQDIHLPEAMAQTVPARRRLAFDELFRLQLALVAATPPLEADARAIRHAVSPREVPTAPRSVTGHGAAPAPRRPHRLAGRRVLGLAPVPPDRRPAAALAEIFADLAGPLPMHRLLQGDVGSGKTVVAVASLLAAVQGGHQGALMVPTEVLAEQHFSVVRAMTEGLAVADPARLGGDRPVAVALLTSRASASAPSGPGSAGLRQRRDRPRRRHPRAC